MADQGIELSPSTGDQQRVSRLCARVVTITDIGRRRHNNQDNHLILPLPASGGPPQSETAPLGIDDDRLLMAVADGMGGHFGGEVASRICVDSLAKEISDQFQTNGNGDADVAAALRKAVEAAHHAVYTHAQEREDSQVMGTTLTAGLLHRAHLDLAQVGDSRAYLFRGGNLIILTQDQTIGTQLRSRGEDPATVDPRIQEMLLQAVGAQSEIEVVMTDVDLEPSDLLMICCDGLYKVVPPPDIVDTLEAEMGLQEKVESLVNRANEAGGPDNITIILAEICPVESAH